MSTPVTPADLLSGNLNEPSLTSLTAAAVRRPKRTPTQKAARKERRRSEVDSETDAIIVQPRDLEIGFTSPSSESSLEQVEVDDSSSDEEPDAEKEAAYHARRARAAPGDIATDNECPTLAGVQRWLFTLFVLALLLAAAYTQHTHPGGLKGLFDRQASSEPSNKLRVTDPVISPSVPVESNVTPLVPPPTIAVGEPHPQQPAESPAVITPPAAIPPASASLSFEQCGAAHLSSVTSSLYHSCPVTHMDWDSLESIGDVLKRTNGVFKTSSKYNPGYPIQVFHNLCIGGKKEQRFESWINTGPLEGEPGFASESPQEQASPTPFPDVTLFDDPPQSKYKHRGWMYKWKSRRHPPIDWKYMRGTTTHHTFVSAQNFGHTLIDNLMPMMMGLQHPEPECAHLHSSQIDRVLVDVGCEDDSAGQAEASAAATVATNPNQPPHHFAENQVCPLHEVGAVSTRWLLRLAVANPSLYPPPPSFGGQPSPLPSMARDGIAGVKFVTLHKSAKTKSEECKRLSGICFERFVVLGRQEDREMKSCGGYGNKYTRSVLHTFRNTTFRVFQLPEPFLVLPTARNAAVTAPTAGRPGVPRVLLYGREDSWRRKWLDVAVTKKLLDTLESEGRISLTHTPRLGSLSVCDQVRLFSQADVILMPQGAGILATVWSPEGALVLEVFPSAGGGSWTAPMRTGLDQRVKHLHGTPAPRSSTSQQYRANGQDDDFTLAPEEWLREFEAFGIDVSSARTRVKEAAQPTSSQA